MEQEIERVLLDIGNWLWANTIGLIDPFWGYALEVSVLILIALAASYFFPVLRSVSGAVVMAAIAFLVGFWKGEDAKKKPRK